LLSLYSLNYGRRGRRGLRAACDQRYKCNRRERTTHESRDVPVLSHLNFLHSGDLLDESSRAARLLFGRRGAAGNARTGAGSSDSRSPDDRASCSAAVQVYCVPVGPSSQQPFVCTGPHPLGRVRPRTDGLDRTTSYWPSWSFIIASIFALTASRLKVA